MSDCLLACEKFRLDDKCSVQSLSQSFMKDNRFRAFVIEGPDVILCFIDCAKEAINKLQISDISRYMGGFDRYIL